MKINISMYMLINGIFLGENKRFSLSFHTSYRESQSLCFKIVSFNYNKNNKNNYIKSRNRVVSKLNGQKNFEN